MIHGLEKIQILFNELYWLVTSSGRLRFAQAIAHLLRHRFGRFVKRKKKKERKKETPTKKIDQIFCLGGKRLAILPTDPYANIIAFPGDDNFSIVHN